MDNIETDLVHPARDKSIIDDYFNLTIKKELNIDINFTDEYVVAQNIVSKKLILVKTFSEIIMINPELYFLMQSLIQKINTGVLSKKQIVETLEALRKNK